MPSPLLDAAEGFLPEFAFDIVESIEDSVGILGTLIVFAGLFALTLFALKIVQNSKCSHTGLLLLIYLLLPTSPQIWRESNRNYQGRYCSPARSHRIWEDCAFLSGESRALQLSSSTTDRDTQPLQLAHGKKVETVTSMKELDAETTLHSSDEEGSEKIYKILDFPGHPRLRG
jgi:hypothetical protein